MRQSPDDQIVRIESELRAETLHSSTVREALGMKHLTACVTAFTTVPSSHFHLLHLTSGYVTWRFRLDTFFELPTLIQV